jgi:hypothetical protein
MLQNYEAVVVTTDGTYRAYHAAETVICVTEDGIEGIIDFIYQDENEPVQGAPEMLVTVLIAWVYEMRRGLNLVSASLHARGQRPEHKDIDIEP